MANYVVSDITFTSLADTIRTKGGTSAPLKWPQGYNAAINAINPLTLSVNTSGPSSIVTVNDATDLDAKQVMVDIEPVQAGSGDPSPTNVRPITGWTGAQVTRTGINVWDEEWVRGTVDWNTRKITSDAQGARICSKNFIPVKSGGTYYINYQHFGNAVFGYADEYANGIDISVPDSTKLCTIPAGIQFIKFAALISDYGSDTYQNDISINYPATDTQYHPYTGNQISVTFPSEAGTVYGGTLDVTNGVLTVDRAMVTFNGGSSEQWWLSQGYTNRFGNNTGISNNGDETQQLSNWLKASQWGTGNFSFGFRNDGALYIRLDGSAAQITEAEFRAQLAASPIQIIYGLASPVTYNLTPQDIELLSGYNVIFADCGDVALSYYTENFASLADEIDFVEGGDY